jgi:hypothetical protein
MDLLNILVEFNDDEPIILPARTSNNYALSFDIYNLFDYPVNRMPKTRENFREIRKIRSLIADVIFAFREEIQSRLYLERTVLECYDRRDPSIEQTIQANMAAGGELMRAPTRVRGDIDPRTALKLLAISQ